MRGNFKNIIQDFSLYGYALEDFIGFETPEGKYFSNSILGRKESSLGALRELLDQKSLRIASLLVSSEELPICDDCPLKDMKKDNQYFLPISVNIPGKIFYSGLDGKVFCPEFYRDLELIFKKNKWEIFNESNYNF